MLKRIEINTRHLSNGTQLTIPIYQFSGTNKNAPSVYIQSGIHGAEIQGYAVIISLIQHFLKSPPYGNVTLVPQANPYGVNYKIGDYTYGRFDPATGDNWNRNYLKLTCPTAADQTFPEQIIIKKFVQQYINYPITELYKNFKFALENVIKTKLHQPENYSHMLNLQLQSIACTNDIVLDLHCDTNSLPHIYSPSYASLASLKFQIPYIIKIPHIFNGALDEATFCPWWELYNELRKSKKNLVADKPDFESYTIELGNQEYINLEEGAKFAQNIIFYLASKGICKFINPTTNNEMNSATNTTLLNNPISYFSCKLKDFLNIYSPSGGLLVQTWPLGLKVEHNHPIAQLININSLQPEKIKDNPEIYKHIATPVHSPASGIPITRTNSANIHQGTSIMKIMTNTEIESNNAEDSIILNKY